LAGCLGQQVSLDSEVKVHANGRVDQEVRLSVGALGSEYLHKPLERIKAQATDEGWAMEEQSGGDYTDVVATRSFRNGHEFAEKNFFAMLSRSATGALDDPLTYVEPPAVEVSTRRGPVGGHAQFKMVFPAGDVLAGRVCSECEGTGEVTCPHCDGQGTVKCWWCDGTGSSHGRRCSACNGTGKRECNWCDGTGRVKCDACGGTGGASWQDQMTVQSMTGQMQFVTVNHRVVLPGRIIEANTRESFEDTAVWSYRMDVKHTYTLEARSGYTRWWQILLSAFVSFALFASLLAYLLLRGRKMGVAEQQHPPAAQ
jgi:hypothetical protein